MFETLYSAPGVLRRHCEAPLAAERETYLKKLTVRHRSKIELCGEVCLLPFYSQWVAGTSPHN